MERGASGDPLMTPQGRAARPRTGPTVVTGAPAVGSGVAFAAWSAAFAVGALIHLWQGWSFGPLTAVAAFAVLLRPASPARLMGLLGLLLAEVVASMPDVSNHQIPVAVLGLTVIPWWLVLRWRSPAAANDPALLYAQVAPYLRVAFVVTWLVAALSKLNSGFFDPAGTCSVWILESIPGVSVPPLLAPAVIGGAVAVELAIPLLLLAPRTRPLAVLLGLGFHLVSAFAGHSTYSGFAWSFYLLFLPPTTIARAVVLARKAVPQRVRAVLAATAHAWPTLLVLGVAWWLGHTLMPESLQSPARNWGAALVCTAWMCWCGWLLFRIRRHWLHAPGPRLSMRVHNPLMLVGIALLVSTAAMPYLGLKSQAALTMFSNLRTEPGHWNHLLVPEAVRIFGWQDGEVRYLGSDDPALDAKIAANGRDHTVLLDLRLLVDEFPNATVRYTLDGIQRVAAPLATDPVLGAPTSATQEWFAAMRPYTDGDTCQQ